MRKQIFSVIAALFLFSCSIKLNPAKSDDAVTKVKKIQTDINKLYSGASYYNDVVDQYVLIETEISNLKTFDQARPKSNTLVNSVTILQNRVLKYDKEHKGYNHISAPVASLYKDYLTEDINYIIKSENTYK